MQITVTIPDNIYEEVEAVAEKQNRSVGDVIAETVTQAFNPFPLDENYAQLLVEKEAYKKLHSELWKQYPHEYVAIAGGNLLDHDKDITSLHERIEEKYPNAVVLLEKVLPMPERIMHVRSPRLIRGSL